MTFWANLIQITLFVKTALATFYVLDRIWPLLVPTSGHTGPCLH